MGVGQSNVIRCSGANIMNMAQRITRLTFTGTAKLNKLLEPMPKRYTILYAINECVDFSSSKQATAKPTLEK